MPEKKAVAGKKTEVKKPAAVKKSTVTKKATAVKKATNSSAKKIQKGDAYLCEVCGLLVNVDACGNLETTGLVCCGKAMKEKSKAKAKAKA